MSFFIIGFMKCRSMEQFSEHGLYIISFETCYEVDSRQLFSSSIHKYVNIVNVTFKFSFFLKIPVSSIQHVCSSDKDIQNVHLISRNNQYCYIAIMFFLIKDFLVFELSCWHPHSYTCTDENDNLYETSLQLILSSADSYERLCISKS